MDIRFKPPPKIHTFAQTFFGVSIYLVYTHRYPTDEYTPYLLVALVGFVQKSDSDKELSVLNFSCYTCFNKLKWVQMFRCPVICIRSKSFICMLIKSVNKNNNTYFINDDLLYSINQYVFTLYVYINDL